MAALFRCFRRSRSPDPDDDVAHTVTVPAQQARVSNTSSGSHFRRAPRRKSLSSLSASELIRQALVDLPLAVTTDAEIGSMDELTERAERDEAQWLEIVLQLVPSVPLSNPLSGALISVVLDVLPLPAMRTVTELSPALFESLAKATNTAERRNALIVFAVLADKLAGRASEILLSPELLDLLFAMLSEASDPVTTLVALLAVEKFALTGVNKQRLLQAGFAPVVRDVESKFCILKDGQGTGASAGVSSKGKISRRNSFWQRLSKELTKAQAGFCAMWILDNILPCDGRPYAATCLDLSKVNVMLDYQDATKHLKLAPDGLEARNDSLTFESVRATCKARGTGLWYYEVTVFTGGIMQIGWATDRCAYQSEEGIGIGDDQHSFSYDGCRRLFWYAQRSIQHHHPKWKPGDVLGLYLDLDGKKINFSLNGHELGWAKLPCAPDDGLYPAVSLMTFQHVKFNFGNEPYRYPPTQPFRSLNGVGKMTDEQKSIVPRLVMLAQLQDEHQEEDDDTPRCQICFDNAPSVVLLPCKHAEFCADCAAQCASCPLCRAEIETMKPIGEEGADDDGGDASQ